VISFKYTLSVILLFAFNYVLKVFSMKTGLLLEYPDERKNHKKPVPLIGGTVLFLTLLTLSNLGLYNSSIIRDPIFYLVFIIGFIDDLFELPYYTKLMLQIAVAVIYTNINLFYLVPELQLINKIVTAVFFVVILNAFNLIDGVNGLLLGISIVYSLLNFDFTFTFLLFLLIILNFNEKLFMGDSGAFLIAYLLLKNQNVSHSLINLSIYFGYPLYEIASSFLRRLLLGKNPFKPDRYHLHHIGVEKLGLLSFLVCAYLLSLGFSLISSKKLGIVIYLVVCSILFIVQIIRIRRLNKFESMSERNNSNLEL